MPRTPPELDRAVREGIERRKKLAAENPVKQLLKGAREALVQEMKALVRANKKTILTAKLNGRVWGELLGGSREAGLRDALIRKDGTSREDMIRRRWELTTANDLMIVMGTVARVDSEGPYPRMFHQVITISHQDGTFMHLPNACYARVGSLIVVWTEHCGYHMFNREDLHGYRAYPMMRNDTSEPLEEVE